MGEPESQAGRVLGGRFRLEHQLGEGGFGTIWRAEQLVLGATVAVKLIDLAIARQAGALERFLREAQAAATLRSPHVVQILDYGVEGDQPFIAMELLEGETLAQRLHRVGRLAPSESLRIVTHVARAMSRAHECNIVHRDLKPENVFLVRNEDDEVAKVLDFGVAKMKSPILIDESTQTRTGSLIGTPHYMSPEQVQGNKTVDYRSDIWALGVIAFEMFTGQRPFTGNALGDLVLQICVRDIIKPSQLAPVPAGFDEWFSRAAERDQEKRFQSARELAQSLRDVVGGTETSLVVSSEIDESRSVDDVSTSSIIPNHREPAAPVTGGSIELADTIFSPLDPSARGRSLWQHRPLLWVTAAALLGAVIALGVWYSNAKKVGHFRTSFVAASASASNLGSANISQAESAPSVRTAGSASRLPAVSHNPTAARRPANSPAACNLRPGGDATKGPDASTKAPSLSPANSEAPTIAPAATAMRTPESPGLAE
jgi:serine/threonine protein kinase